MPTTEVQIRNTNRSTVLSWFRGLFGKARNLVLWQFGTREVLSDIDQTRAIQMGFNANAMVYAIIKDTADKFASIPRYLYDAKAIEAKMRRKIPMHLKALTASEKYQNNALAKLLQRPNPYQGQAAFYKLAMAYYKTCGETFIWLNRGDIGELNDLAQDRRPVLEMYVLPSDHMEVVPDPTDPYGIEGYILDLNGQKMPIRKNDIIHWKDLNLEFDASTRVHLRGMTPFKPGGLTLQLDNEITHGEVRMVQNDGAKGVLYAEEGKRMSPEQESSMRGVVDKKINNSNIKGAVASLFGMGKLGYLDIGATSVDMNLVEFKKSTLLELCALLGVPVELYDPETQYANKAAAQKNWVSNKIIPACKEFDDEMNRQLLRAFGLEGLAVIASDFTELPEMQENMKELAEWLAIAVWLKMDEKREMMGYEKEGGLFDEPWLPNNLTPLSQLEEPDDGMGDLLGDYNVNPAGQVRQNGQAQAQPVN